MLSGLAWILGLFAQLTYRKRGPAALGNFHFASFGALEATICQATHVAGRSASKTRLRSMRLGSLAEVLGSHPEHLKQAG